MVKIKKYYSQPAGYFCFFVFFSETKTRHLTDEIESLAALPTFFYETFYSFRLNGNPLQRGLDS